jgi:type IV pilus assembly protein PilW
MDGIVDTYDQLQPATNFCSWARISAIRFVLVSRSVQFEAQNGQPQIVTPLGSLVWDGDPANQINVAAIPNWQSYRYKTFQTTVPIRNANWMGVGPGLGSATTPPQSVPTC